MNSESASEDFEGAFPRRPQSVHPAESEMQSILPAPDQFISLPETSSRADLKLAYVSLASSVTIFILMAVALCLHRWVRYCSEEYNLFGLYLHDSIYAFTQVNDEFCRLSSISFSQCGDFCTSISCLMKGGKMMLALGCSALSLLSCAVVTALLHLFYKRRNCYRVLFSFFLFAATAIWIIGTLIYVGYYTFVSGDETETSRRAGIDLSIAVAVLQLVNCGLSNIAIASVL